VGVGESDEGKIDSDVGAGRAAFEGENRKGRILILARILARVPAKARLRIPLQSMKVKATMPPPKIGPVSHSTASALGDRECATLPTKNGAPASLEGDRITPPTTSKWKDGIHIAGSISMIAMTPLMLYMMLKPSGKSDCSMGGMSM
jgi:hypothetical protein